MKTALSVLLLFLLGSTARGQCIVDISTGFDDDAGGVLAEGVNDDDYTVDVPDDPDMGPQATFTGGGPPFPIPPWVANSATSLWISSTESSTDDPGVYTYEIRFEVPAEVEASQLSLAGQWTADDRATDLVINGTSTGLTVANFGALTAFPVNTGLGLFQAGENVVQFLIENGVPDPTPTGLRVDACVQLSAPDERDVDISTGFDQESLVVLGDDEADDDYTLLGPENSGIAGPAIAATGCPIPPWLANDIQSRWVSAANCSGPSGDYVYSVTFELPAGVDALASGLLGGFAADDSVVETRINGISAGIASTVGFDTFTPFPPLAGRGLLQNGENTIEFVVSNGGENPTGLRVDGEVDLCPTPPPDEFVVPSVFSIDTGFSQETGTTIENGSLDDNYELVGPVGTGLCRITARVINDDAFPVAPVGPWLASSAQSKWIGPQADSNGPPGTYTYRIRLDIPEDVNVLDLRLVGSWSSDNAGLDIVVNGTSTGISQNGDFTVAHIFPPDAGLGLFVVGENVVEFVVENALPGSGPTGLRVEGVVGAGTSPRDLSTGLGARRIGPLPAGFSDGRYTVEGPLVIDDIRRESADEQTGGGAGLFIPAAVVVPADGFPIPPWVPNSGNARWVGLDGADSLGDVGAYLFTAPFTVGPELNPHKLILAGSWAAAQRGIDVQLNGHSLIDESVSFDSLTPLPQDAGRGFFQAEDNVLDFLTQNLEEGPVGLRVEAVYRLEPRVHPFDISTGFNQETAEVIGDGEPDDQYRFDLFGAKVPPAVVVESAPIPPWIANTATSRWIGVDNSGSNLEPMSYQYEVRVTLSAVEAKGAKLVGGWAADDSGDDILINFQSTGLGTTAGFTALTMFPPDFGLGLFREGENLIQFLVTNDGTALNHTGLRVDAVVQVSGGGSQRPGDCNQDGTLDISDGVCLLGHLFLGEPETLPCGGGTAQDPGNQALLDSNGDGTVDISDAVSVFGFLFLGSPPPVSGVDCLRIEGCDDVCG